MKLLLDAGVGEILAANVEGAFSESQAMRWIFCQVVDCVVQRFFGFDYLCDT